MRYTKHLRNQLSKALQLRRKKLLQYHGVTRCAPLVSLLQAHWRAE
jgi:hypothetical protein